MNKTVSNFLLGFLAGAAAGAIAGILFAPDKGSTTRQNIRKKVLDLSDELGLGINELIDDMGLETEPASRPKRKTTRKAKSVKRDA
jgi:gas vesicle protein